MHAGGVRKGIASVRFGNGPKVTPKELAPGPRFRIQAESRACNLVVVPDLAGISSTTMLTSNAGREPQR
jgi:hypothetical protein